MKEQTHQPVLIVSATRLEIEPLIKRASKIVEREEELLRIKLGSNLFDILISGVGIPSATYNIASFLAANSVSLAIHLGIAGSYSDELANGTVVMIVEEEYGDLGIDQGSDFGTLFEAGLISPDHAPFVSGKLINKFPSNIILPEKLKKVRGLTVNMVTSNKTIIQSRKRKFNSDIETMESAAFFYCCLINEVPFLSLRGISNKAGEGDKSRWVISESIQNVCQSLMYILQKNNYFNNET